MPEEGFLRRWARMKASGEANGGAAIAEARPPVPPAVPVAPVSVADPAPPPAPERPGLTLEDAARLTPDSDFSAFVGQAVDKDVRRLALKKLFADPHFNVLDRLDMYMDDYNKPDPVSSTMLAALHHARGALRRPEEVQAELKRLALGASPVEAAAPADEIGPEDGAQEATQEAALTQQDVPGAIDAADPDSLVRLQPATGAHEHDATLIALDSPDAHNGETRP